MFDLPFFQYDKVKYWICVFFEAQKGDNEAFYKAPVTAVTPLFHMCYGNTCYLKPVNDTYYPTGIRVAHNSVEGIAVHTVWFLSLIHY